MLVNQVALVAEDDSVDLPTLTAAAAALQKQATRDFTPLWMTRSEVSAFARLEDMPLDYWPIIIKADIGDPSAAGYHEDDHGQPFALVQYSDDWTLTASHELLEMLADPFGRRMVAGNSPKTGQGRVKFLVEVCDPCEDKKFAYTVNEIVVSDFYTPHFFDPVPAPGVRYSYTNSIKQPRQVLKNGYLSWFDLASKTWWQRTWWGAKPADTKLNLKIVNGNLRSAVDRVTSARQAQVMSGSPTKQLALATRAVFPKKGTPGKAFTNRAEHIRATIDGIIAAAKK